MGHGTEKGESVRCGVINQLGIHPLAFTGMFAVRIEKWHGEVMPTRLIAIPAIAAAALAGPADAKDIELWNDCKPVHVFFEKREYFEQVREPGKIVQETPDWIFAEVAGIGA